MHDPERRLFLQASAAGLGTLLPALSEAQLPVPPAVGRTFRDAQGRRALLYSLLGDLPDRQRPITARKRDERNADGRRPSPAATQGGDRQDRRRHQVMNAEM